MKISHRCLAAACAAAFAFPAGAVVLHAQTPTIDSFAADRTSVIKGGNITLRWQTTGADGVSIVPGLPSISNDGAITFPAGTSRVIVPAGALWSYLPDGGGSLADSSSEIVAGNPAYGSGNWKHPSFDDSSWLEGQAELGYGDAPATEIPFGPDPNNANNDPNSRFPAYYFRRELNLTAADIASLDLVILQYQRDDGAIIYVNGVEVVRSNLPQGAVDSSTLATGIAGGAEESVFFHCFLDPALLAPGLNVIAAEVHQGAVDSSDVSFNLQLSNVSGAQRADILPAAATWRFLDNNGATLANTSSNVVAGAPGYDASNWKHPSFNDGSWQTGTGVFGYDASAISEATLLDFGPDPNDKRITYYFRRTFNIPDALTLAAIQSVTANLLRDDGAVIYVNGIEVARVNMPASPAVISGSTPASSGISGTAETTRVAVDIPAAVLQLGENIVAVEMHQTSPNSSDISFDLGLVTNDGTTDTARIPNYSVWRFLDTGPFLDDSSVVVGNPGYGPSSWKHPAFDDSGWLAGPGELGYGDSVANANPETFTTNLSFGRFTGSKHTTAYFRTNFTVTQAQLNSFEAIEMLVRRDDGVVVYLNGSELLRSNMAEGEVTSATSAIQAAPDDGGAALVTRLTPSAFQAGTNTIAVELHQQVSATGAVTSSDAVFDLVIAGVAPADSATYTLTATNSLGSAISSVDVNFIDPFTDRVFLTTSNVDSVDWDMPEVWSNKLAPQFGSDYWVYDYYAPVLRTPAGVADPIFFGDRLIMDGAGAQLLLSHGSGTAFVAEHVMNGGLIGNTQTAALGLGSFGGSLEAAAPFIIRNGGSNRSIEILSDISGSENITIDDPSGTSTVNTSVVFHGSNLGFTGTIFVSDVLRVDRAEALGAGTVVINDDGTLDPESNFSALAAATLEVPGSGTIVVDQIIALASGAFVIGGAVIPDGTYTAADLAALGFGGTFVAGGGQIRVGQAAPPPDTDGDGIADLLETAFGTDPNNASSGAEGLPVIRRSDGNLTLVFRRLTTPGALTYIAEVSERLRIWTPLAQAPTLAADQSGLPPGFERVEVSIPVGGGAEDTRYLRLRIQSN